MAAAEKLSYEDRFGNAIRGNVAAVNAAIASGKQDAQAQKQAPSAGSGSAAPAKGKHTDWFTDGKGYGDAPKTAAQAKPRLKKISPGMALRELAEATIHNMGVMGEDSYEEFERAMRRMVPEHRMKKSVKASILNDKPHFGHCRIGKVPFKQEQVGSDVIITELQYYIANFNSVISTADPSKIHNPQGKEFGRTFFGVVVDIDRNSGAAIGFNKAYGNEGLVFQTDNPKEALKFMTAFSSGKKPEEIAEMMDRASRQIDSTPAPGMRR